MVPGPEGPAVEEVGRLLEGELEDEGEVLFQKVGAEQGLVDVLDPGQLADLPVAQVLGVLPKCPTGALEPAGVEGIAIPAGVVPDLASDLIQGLGGPGHDVQGVEADDSLWTVEADDLGDPGGTVGADVGDQQRAAIAQGLEEAGQRLLISAFGRPD